MLDDVYMLHDSIPFSNPNSQSVIVTTYQYATVAEELGAPRRMDQLLISHSPFPISIYPSHYTTDDEIAEDYKR